MIWNIEKLSIFLSVAVKVAWSKYKQVRSYPQGLSFIDATFTDSVKETYD